MEKVQDRELQKANLKYDRNIISTEALKKKINEQLISRKFCKYWVGL